MTFNLFGRRSRSTKAATSRLDRQTRPALESLEDRQLFAVSISFSPVSGFTNLNSPVLLANADDGSNRMFAVEQPGRIQVRQPNGTVGQFLNISSTATVPAQRRVQFGGEQGLLGLAFHPNYATNGLFYVHHTRSGLPNTNDIVEYRVSTSDPNVADPTSERLLLRISQRFSNHNGGSVEFGPDGFLYIGKGDGGSGNDPDNNAQNRNSLLGKILRIDVNSDAFPADPNRNYAIPADNPFATGGGAPEVYAWGLRNPYRFSFDRGTGLLYVGDVGQGAREEIDIVVKGGNYGWRPFEGFIPTPAGFNPAESNALGRVAIDPITDLPRSLAASITGGYVYRGSEGNLPVGSYLFGDYITRRVFLFQDGVRTELEQSPGNISSFGEDEAGEVYLVRYSGIIYKVVTNTTNRPPVLDALTDRQIPATQSTVTATLSATDPNGDALSYSATLKSVALDTDTRLGLRTFPGGNLFENFFGSNEKWLLDRQDQWYFILPTGQLYLWDGSSSASGSLIATLGSTYHSRIDLLYNAQLAFDLDLTRGLNTYAGGDLFLNYGGQNEKWLVGSNGAEYFILPNGQFYLWNGTPAQAVGTLIADLGANYYDQIQLLHRGDEGQALASVSVSGTNLVVTRESGFVSAFIVTAKASDGELTDSKSFTVTITV